MDHAVHDVGMHHANMVHGVMEGLQDVLQQEPVQVEAHVVIQEPQVAYMGNSVQNNQHQLAAQLHQIHNMMQEMQLQYSAAPQPTYQLYGGQGRSGGNNRFRGHRGIGYQL